MKTLNQSVRGEERPSIRMLYALGVFFWITCSATAQQADASAAPSAAPMEVPAGCLLENAPAFSKWTVTFTYQKDPNPAAAPRTGSEPSQMIVTKTRNIIREEIVDGKGQRTETWHVGATQYRKPAGDSTWYEAGPTDNGFAASDPTYSPMPANGFRGWDWIGKDTYTGTTALDLGTCLVFVPGGSTKLNLSNPARIKEQLAAQPVVAYVSEDKRLPVALRMGTMLQRFQFAQPPDAMQTLSPDLNEQIKKGEEGRARLYQPAPRPY